MTSCIISELAPIHQTAGKKRERWMYRGFIICKRHKQNFYEIARYRASSFGSLSAAVNCIDRFFRVED